MTPHVSPATPCSRAFTLVELMVSMTVIMVIMLILLSLTNQASKTWRLSSARIEQFRQARVGFEAMTARLSAATLNTYVDYDNPAAPRLYERRSELRFLCGPADDLLGLVNPNGIRVTHSVFFQAPLGYVETQPATGLGYKGLDNLLNTWGYFVEYGNDSRWRPAFMNSLSELPMRYRFRLMEFMQGSEQMNIYSKTSGYRNPSDPNSGVNSKIYIDSDWYKTAANAVTPPAHVLAENVIALILTPRLSKREEEALPGYNVNNPEYSPLAPKYTYDSTKTSSNPELNPKNQLPPVVQVTMVAIDEASASRLSLDANSLTADNRVKDIATALSLFRDSAKYTDELSLNPEKPNSLESILVKYGIGYRIFSSKVALKGARWSRLQAN